MRGSLRVPFIIIVSTIQLLAALIEKQLSFYKNRAKKNLLCKQCTSYSNYIYIYICIYILYFFIISNTYDDYVIYNMHKMYINIIYAHILYISLKNYCLISTMNLGRLDRNLSVLRCDTCALNTPRKRSV